MKTTITAGKIASLTRQASAKKRTVVQKDFSSWHRPGILAVYRSRVLRSGRRSFASHFDTPFPMDSLFVISLPRSLSSFVYHVSRAALGLKNPSWTSDGEVLNAERFVLCREPEETGWPKYTQPSEPDGLNARLSDFLDQVTVRNGFAYKDVIQPFVVSKWLPSTNLKVLKIRRNLADVAYSMMNHKWYYPEQAGESRHREHGERVFSVVNGLLRAQRVQATVPGESVDFDDFVRDCGVFCDALRRLYPDQEVPRFDYLTEAFCRDRDRVLARRSTEEFHQLEEIVRAVTKEYDR